MKKVSLGMITLAALLSGNANAAAGCVGKVGKLWVENNNVLYFDIQPTGECVCNFNVANKKGFEVPADAKNKDDQYAMLLSSFMAGVPVQAWFDWQSSDTDAARCRSWNTSVSIDY